MLPKLSKSRPTAAQLSETPPKKGWFFWAFLAFDYYLISSNNSEPFCIYGRIEFALLFELFRGHAGNLEAKAKCAAMPLSTIATKLPSLIPQVKAQP